MIRTRTKLQNIKKSKLGKSDDPNPIQPTNRREKKRKTKRERERTD